MKKMKRLLAVVLSLLMVMWAVFVPVSAEEVIAEYPNTDSFSWGVNGHITYLDSEIEAYMALAAKLGAKLYRVDLPNIAQLAKADKIVRAANAYGIDVMLVVGGDTLTADEITALYGQIARHYKTGDFGTVKYIQIFNETEFDAYIEDTDGTSSEHYDATKITEMAERFKAAYNAVKGVSVDYITVVNYSWLHDPYLSLLVDEGVRWDVTGLNWYTNMETAASDGLTTALDRLAADEALAAKNVIITESNVNYGSDVIDDNLISVMNTAYSSEKVIGMCFYELLDEPEHELENERSYGLVNYTTETGIGAVKDIYTSIQTLIGGSDSVVKGEFTPSAAYPDGTTTFEKTVALDGIVTASDGSGSIDLAQSYNMFDYDAVELDIYVESADTADTTVCVMLQSTDWSARKASITVPANQWVHKVIYIDSFLNYGADTSDICRLSVEGVAAGNTANIVNAAFVNGVNPEMSNTYNLAKEVNYELHYTQVGDTETARTNKTLGETVNLKAYDYLEFDVKVDSAGTGITSAMFQLFAYDTNKAFQLKSFTVNTDEWVHISTAAPSGWGYGEGDITAVSSFQLDLIKDDAGCTFHIANMALTNFSPEMNNEYTLAAELNTNIDGAAIWTLGTTYNINNYDYVEFDLYVESETYNNAKVQVLFGDPQNGARRSNFTIATNQWVHKVIKVSEMSDYACDETNVTKFGVEYCRETETGSNNNISTVYLRNAALTNFAPEADYTYNLALDLETDLKTSQANCVQANFKETAIDFTKYDYVEFDVYVGGEDTNGFRLQFINGDGTGYGFYGVPAVEANTWTHIAIPVSSIDCGWGFGGDATKFGAIKIIYDFMVSGVQYYVYNMALTNFAPEADYTYYLGKELDYSLDLTYAGDPWATYKSIGETVDFTEYDYLEFDIYVESENETATEGVLVCNSMTDRSWFTANQTVATNQWVHVVYDMSKLTTWDQGATSATAVQYLMFDWLVSGDKYHVRNVAVTLAEEPAAVTWGDATGDGSVDIRDLVRMKKLAVYAEGYEDYDIEEYKYADLDEDGMIDAPDLVIIRQYLLGIITSLDPTA